MQAILLAHGVGISGVFSRSSPRKNLQSACFEKLVVKGFCGWFLGAHAAGRFDPVRRLCGLPERLLSAGLSASWSAALSVNVGGVVGIDADKGHFI